MQLIKSFIATIKNWIRVSFKGIVQLKHNIATATHDHHSHHLSQKQLQLISQPSILEEIGSPYRYNLVVYIISFFVMSVIVWSTVTTVKEVSKTTGEIIPSAHIQVIQHLEGGTISKILVSEGQHVEKGELLLSFAGDSLKGELEKAKAKETTLKLQADRYKSFSFQESHSSGNIDKNYQDLFNKQKEFLQDMIDNREKQKKVIQEQIKQSEESVKISETKISTFKKNLELSIKNHTLKKELYNKGYSSITQVIEAEKEVNQLRGDILQNEAEMEKNKYNINELKARLSALETTLRDQVNEWLAKIESERAENNTVINKITRQIDQLDIKSPMKGIVKGIELKTIGAVASPGQKLMEIVPLDDVMIAEVKISPTDVGNIKTGQLSIIKVSAFDFARYGAVDGKLINVSASTFMTKEGEVYYKGLIELTKNYMGTEPHKNILLPGMLVTADIVTGEKTIMSYIIKPIKNVLNNALKER